MLRVLTRDKEREDTLKARSVHTKQQILLTKTNMSTLPNVTKLTLGPLISITKGAKQIQVSHDGAHLVWTPSEFLDVPFEPSNFSDKEAARLSICFCPTKEIENFLNIFESWCVKALAKRSQEFLGSEHTSADQREIPVKSQNIGERLSIIEGKDKYSRKGFSAVLDSRQSEMLAANILERLQGFATNSR